MEILIDVLDSKTGKKTGKAVTQKEAHSTGLWHGSIHILLISTNGKKTVLQKRSPNKYLYPNTWDIAVGGHIDSGEDAITSAKRELFEELGISVNKTDLKYITTVKEQLNNNGVISNEFVSIFVLYYDLNVEDLKLQDEEVSEVKWVNIAELNSIIDEKVIIPHKEDFVILNDIMVK